MIITVHLFCWLPLGHTCQIPENQRRGHVEPWEVCEQEGYCQIWFPRRNGESPSCLAFQTPPASLPTGPAPSLPLLCCASLSPPVQLPLKVSVCLSASKSLPLCLHLVPSTLSQVPALASPIHGHPGVPPWLQKQECMGGGVERGRLAQAGWRALAIAAA